jgi:hypothetical protein
VAGRRDGVDHARGSGWSLRCQAAPSPILMAAEVRERRRQYAAAGEQRLAAALFLVALRHGRLRCAKESYIAPKKPSLRQLDILWRNATLYGAT